MSRGVLVLICGGLLTAAAMSLPACHPSRQVKKAHATNGVEERTNGKATHWPFWPADVRIHPLSRVTTDQETGDRIIEIRLEFFDPEGHTMKAVGQVRFDLHRQGESANTAPLQTWEQRTDLRDMELNRLYFDDVTQTYLFRLPIEEAVLPARPQVRAYYLGADGATLQTEREIRVQRE